MRSFKRPLKLEEEKRYFKAYREGDETAKEMLIEHNLRLVAHVAKKYYTKERELDDLLSIGTVGLIKAIHTFDEEKGGCLATYAARCIENELLMMLRQEKKWTREVSLNEPIGTDPEGNHIHLMDVMDNGAPEMLDDYVKEHYLSQLEQAVMALVDERERLIIRKRYGMFGYEAHTQREVAKELKISRSYVSRIEKRALEHLRSYLDPEEYS